MHMPTIEELAGDVALPRTNELTVKATTYAGMRIFIDIEDQSGKSLASVVKGAPHTQPRRWQSAKVSCAFSIVTPAEAEVYARALGMAIREAMLLDQLYPPGTEGNDL